eukprot:gene58288-biopygen18526
MMRELIAFLWLATDVAKAYDELIREAITAAMEGLGCPIWWITHWERSWDGRKEEHKSMITIDLHTEAAVDSCTLYTTNEVESTITVKDGALWMQTPPKPEPETIREIRYVYPFQLQWELTDKEAGRQTTELPRHPAAFRKIMTELNSMGNT